MGKKEERSKGGLCVCVCVKVGIISVFVRCVRTLSTAVGEKGPDKHTERGWGGAVLCSTVEMCSVYINKRAGREEGGGKGLQLPCSYGAALLLQCGAPLCDCEETVERETNKHE